MRLIGSLSLSLSYLSVWPKCPNFRKPCYWRFIFGKQVLLQNQVSFLYQSHRVKVKDTVAKKSYIVCPHAVQYTVRTARPVGLRLSWVYCLPLKAILFASEFARFEKKTELKQHTIKWSKAFSYALDCHRFWVFIFVFPNKGADSVIEQYRIAVCVCVCVCVCRGSSKNSSAAHQEAEQQQIKTVQCCN